MGLGALQHCYPEWWENENPVERLFAFTSDERAKGENSPLAPWLDELESSPDWLNRMEKYRDDFRKLSGTIRVNK